MEPPFDAEIVADPAADWHSPKPVRPENEHEISQLDAIQRYDPVRYDGWNLEQIEASLGGFPVALLKRATLRSLVARREIGGLFVAACVQTNSRQEQETLFRRLMDLSYPDARRHMKLWSFWYRIEDMLRDREQSCRRRAAQFIVPGYRSCLQLAGLEGRSEPPPYKAPPPPIEQGLLPDDVDGLKKLIECLQRENRLEREARTHLQVKLDLAQDEIREFDFNAQREARRPRVMYRARGRLRRTAPLIESERTSDVEIRIGDCLLLIEAEPNLYHAGVTDAPYGISLQGYEWDSTDISFSRALWSRLFRVMKPGAYVACSAAPRLYHRVAQAAEDAGFTITRTRDRRGREANMSRNPAVVGAFILGALGLSIFGILFFAGTRWFTRNSELVVFFRESLAGLDVGAPVTFDGARIGSVKSLTIRVSPETLSARIPVV